jgi:hypothetical protein
MTQHNLKSWAKLMKTFTSISKEKPIWKIITQYSFFHNKMQEWDCKSLNIARVKIHISI